MNKVLFDTRSLSDVANDPDFSILPRHIFGDYCFEHDLHVLAGDTNVGKTILAMDIAVSFSSGKHYWEEQMSEVNGRTLYINFEMGNNQIYQRYHTADADIIKDIQLSTLDAKAYNLNTDALMNEIRQSIAVINPNLVIIDNLTWLLGNSASATKTSKVMSTLKALKEEFHITMIVIAHFKKRNRKKPISVDDIFGSSAISKIADSISAFGSCGNTRYLKMLKSRSSSVSDDVAVLEINNDPYLHMQLQGYDEEDNYISNEGFSHRAMSREDILEIIFLHDNGKSIREIAKITGWSKSSIGRLIKAYEMFKKSQRRNATPETFVELSM